MMGMGIGMVLENVQNGIALEIESERLKDVKREACS